MLFRQSHFIDRAVSNVTTVLIEAVVIVAIVLVATDERRDAAIIHITTIPVSLAVGLLTMDFMGMGLNVMAAGGLGVAVGVLVDDAIIDVENVIVDSEQNPRAGRTGSRSCLDVIFDASNGTSLRWCSRRRSSSW